MAQPGDAVKSVTSLRAKRRTRLEGTRRMGHLDTIRPEISFRAINLGSASQNILRYGLDETSGSGQS
jgi:hypothetical protein